MYPKIAQIEFSKCATKMCDKSLNKIMKFVLIKIKIVFKSRNRKGFVKIVFDYEHSGSHLAN